MAQGKKYIPKEVDKDILHDALLESLTLTQAVEILGVDYKTFLKNREYFTDTIKKAYADLQIKEYAELRESALTRALGFESEEREYTTVFDESKGEWIEKCTKRKVKNEYNPTLLMLLLINKSDGEFVSINREPKKEIDLEVIQTIKELLTTPV